MPVELKDIVEFIKNMGYEIKIGVPSKNIVDELLGVFEGAIQKETTSTEYLKRLRETGYGKY